MTLTPTLRSPSDILCKLAREQYRAFHAMHPIHKADHLYNFCITALAIKDFILEYLKIADNSKREEYYVEWAKVPVIVAATKIANTSKHFVLRKRKNRIRPIKTKSVKASSSSVVDIYIDKEDKLHNIKRDNVADYDIELDDGTILQVWEFTTAVLQYWEKYYKRKSIFYQKQAKEEYFGVVDSIDL